MRSQGLQRTPGARGGAAPAFEAPRVWVGIGGTRSGWLEWVGCLEGEVASGESRPSQEGQSLLIL